MSLYNYDSPWLGGYLLVNMSLTVQYKKMSLYMIVHGWEDVF